MQLRVGTVERAFQLARSGGFKSVGEVRRQLARENYVDASSQVAGLTLLRHLRRIVREANIDQAAAN